MAKSKSYIEILKEVSGNEFASVVADGITGDIAEFIDTSSYALNALISGSIFGGIPSNKITCFSGFQATGKTYLCFSIVANFLKRFENGIAVIAESEGALTSQMFEERGMDMKRILIVPVVTVEEFRTQMAKILDNYDKTPKDLRPPMMMILDSLGMLSTNKEVADVESGNDKRDMTRAQVIKGAFRVLSLKLSRVNVPLIITNHLYETMDQYSGPQMGGGTGPKFAASVIVFLGKQKQKEDNTIVGNIIPLRLEKGRLTKEFSTTETKLTYENGLDKYWGLVDIGVQGGLFKAVSTKREIPVAFFEVASKDVLIPFLLENKLAKAEKEVKFLEPTQGYSGEEIEIVQVDEKGKTVDTIGYYNEDLKEFRQTKRYFEKHIYNQAEKFFTDDVLQRLDKCAKKVFSYGSALEKDE